MERIAQGRSATLTHTFQVDGVATNPTPDSATVAITRADGTALVPAGSVGDGGTGVVTLTLTPAETALLDVLEVTWTATFGGQAQAFTDYVEVVGGFLFSLSEARALAPLNNTTTYTTAKILDARTQVEQSLEAALGYSLVPRYYEETFSGEGGLALYSRVPLVSNVPGTNIPLVTEVRSVTVDGTAITASDVIPDVTGFYYESGWTTGRRNIVVRYTHGAKYPLERAKFAALQQARSWLVKGPSDDRAQTFANTEGASYALLTAGVGGRQFDIPEMLAVVQEHSLRVGVA